ncbi:hypothetical protein SAMN04487996_112104 [Dyadobacter soli]|uniref:Uncharacterized protein n=1 Tax=Dyadobacter soli TaxID=659014 RepID=A0A1G7NN90_9BACT|nr:hypothetical protein [Dyadobacter soli]SDF75411.1 hypothetical protein SAMN04487996_112104 [Dyadobacter soli]
MESISKKRNKQADLWEDEDPKGPMMVWNGERSEEDRQWMSNWFLARKAELEREKARSAGEGDQAL